VFVANIQRQNVYKVWI